MLCSDIIIRIELLLILYIKFTVWAEAVIDIKRINFMFMFSENNFSFTRRPKSLLGYLQFENVLPKP